MNSFQVSIAALALVGFSTVGAAQSPLSQGARSSSASEALSVFGIALGSPLNLPACPDFVPAAKGKAAPAPAVAAVTCQKPREVRQDSVDVIVQFAPQEAPSFLYSPRVGRNPGDVGARAFTVTLIEGKAEIIHVGTDGRYVQDEVRSKLEAKYGKPVLLRTREFSNQFGGGFEAVEEAWERPNLKVSFTGASGSGDHGEIVFISDAGFEYMTKVVNRAHGSERQL